MRLPRILPSAALPLLLSLSGCGYVHLGRLPPPSEATVIGDEQLLRQNTDLKLEKKMLQQELALTRAQGDALRMAIENRAADGDTSKRLAEKLTDTTRELALLRANYAQLQTEKNQAATSAAESAALQARLGATEEKLADSLRNFTELQNEIGQLRAEVDRTRAENVALGEQVKTVTAQNDQAQAAVAQLNTELLAQKDARARAEQDAETLRTRLQSAPNASALAQQRTGAAPEAHSLAAEHAAEIAALKQQLDTFRAKVGALESERAQLRQELGSRGAAPSPDLANVEAKLASALQTSASLRGENEVLKAATTQLVATKSDLETQLARLKASPATGQVQNLRDQLRDAQAQATALADENAKLKNQLAGPRAGSASPAAADPAGNDRVVIKSISAEPPNRIDLADEPDGPSTVKPAAKSSSVSATLTTSAPGTVHTVARIDPASGQRVHVVAGGDTLSKISILYYGTPARWTDILAANRDILGESNNLVIGRTLRIP